MTDLTKVIQKLLDAGKTTKNANGYNGLFSIKKDSHLLDPDELKMWLWALHNGMKHNDKICTDLHEWNFAIFNEEVNNETH